MDKMKVIAGVLIVITFAGLSANVQAQKDEGLVAEWHFDEGSGSVVADSSGNGNDGVIHGAKWVEGKYGKALSFDGSSDYVQINSPVNIYSGNSPYTVGIWIYVNQYGNFDGTWGGFIFSRGNEASLEAQHIVLDASGYIGLTHWGSDWHTTVKPNLNQWYYITTVWNGSNELLYVNGLLQWTSPTTILNVANTNIALGKHINYNNYYFNGIIDEVCIYNRALSEEEIKALYEGVQLTITKSASPRSIKQGQTTTITLTVKNTGTTEIKDIEVSDTYPPDLNFVSGETSKTYASLKPQDSREFQYILQTTEAGTFNLDPATATYSDEEGNYHTVESKTAAVTVIAYIPQTTPHTTPKSSTEISTASVHLHGEKTDVVMGEDVLLKLSAVNIIGNPTMHVQVIIIPPSGWSVTSSEFAKSGAGQYTTTYDIEEGVGRDIEVRIVPNQIGDDFQVQGRIIYYFGDDPAEREDHTLILPITVRAEADAGSGAERVAGTPESEEASTPGFAAVVAIIGLLAIYLRRKRR